MVPALALLQAIGDRTALEQIATVASIVSSIAIATFAIVAVFIAWRFRNAYKKLNELMARVETEVRPFITNATNISANVGHITDSIRDDVQKVSATVNDANERLHVAIEATEGRVKEFNALIEVVQQEAEDVFVSTAATVRGIRTGAAAFRDDSGASGTEFASDELDPAEVAEEIERQLESQEVGDGFNSSAEPSTEALSAAPRIRPRSRGQRRSG